MLLNVKMAELSASINFWFMQLHWISKAASIFISYIDIFSSVFSKYHYIATSTLMV